MIVTVFRFRLRPEAEADHARWAARTGDLARQVPGYRSHKDFVAADGERVMLVEFESEKAQRVFNDHRVHLEAKVTGRSAFFLEYRVQVCSVHRESTYPTRFPLAALG